MADLSIDFSMVLSPNRGVKPANGPRKTQSSSFVHPAKIVVLGGIAWIGCSRFWFRVDTAPDSTALLFATVVLTPE